MRRSRTLHIQTLSLAPCRSTNDAASVDDAAPVDERVALGLLERGEPERALAQSLAREKAPSAEQKVAFFCEQLAARRRGTKCASTTASCPTLFKSSNASHVGEHVAVM